VARDPRFPPVVPQSDLRPWEQPQTLITRQGRSAAPVVPGALPSSLAGPGSGGGNAGSGLTQWIAEAHRYAKLINLNFAVGVTSVSIIDAPVTFRNFLAFRNTGTTNLFISFGVAATQQSWLRLASNTIILFDAVVPQDDIFAISDAAGGALSVAYSTVAI
jgi:hypothetical protein